MTRLVLKIYDWFSERRWALWTLLGILAGLSVLLISHLSYQEDISAFLPQDEQTRKYTSIYEKMGGQDRIALLFNIKEGVQAEDSSGIIADAIRCFSRKWSGNGWDSTATLQSGIRQEDILGTIDFIKCNIPYFLEDSDYRLIDSLLEQPDFIRATVEKNHRSPRLPGTAGNLSAYDPLHLFNGAYKRLESLNISSGTEVKQGCIFLNDGKTGAAFFNSPYGGSESGGNARLLENLKTLTGEVMAEYPDISISTTGGPVIAAGNAERIKKDSIIAVIAAIIMIGTILSLSFKKWGDVLWIGVSILGGSLFALALAAIFKDSISLIVLGIGSIIIGIAVNYPLHYIDHLKYQPDKRKALKEIVNPLLVGNITTVCAFLSMFLIKAEAIRDFGLVGAAVLVGTIIFVLIFLPVLIKDSKAETRAGYTIDLGRIVPRKLKRHLFLPFVMITLILGFFSTRITFDSDISHINYMDEEQREGLAVLSSAAKRTPGMKTVYAVSEGRNLDEAVIANEALLERIDTGPYRMSSVRTIICSPERQEKKLQAWKLFRQKYPDLAEDVAQEAARQGNPDIYAPFRELMQKEWKVEPAGWFSPLTGAMGSGMILDGKDGKTSIINHIYVPEEECGSFKQQARMQAGEKGFIFDAADAGSQLAGILSEEFDTIGLVCSLVVFIFLWISFGRLEISLMAFIPLAVSWIWILGTMQIAGLQFNIVNIILATFIFGQGDDYTIFITEGLMYEYAYGKKILRSYKNSVALSAIIMFIGIGVLIIARHPAMQSLAQVTIIGMLIVVMMAYYLPPLIFRWMTEHHGHKREVPLTFKRFFRSLGAISFFLLAMLVIVPGTQLYFLAGRTTEKKKLAYHRFLQRISGFIAHHVPGAGCSLENRRNEKFDRPAVIVCNHQSHLDVMYLMMLSPKIVILTNDWVWNNVFYKVLIRKAEFYPVSDGMDKNTDRLRKLVERGYSVVVFPEGTRSADCSIGRFHQGAFALADALGTDVLPVFLHGPGHVLPKKDFMLREGRIHVEIGERISRDDPFMEKPLRERTKLLRKYYQEHYAELCREQEDLSYWIPFVKYQYLYKGKEIWKDCLKQIEDYRTAIDANPELEEALGGRPVRESGQKRILFKNSGIGAAAMLAALYNKDMEICVQENDEEKAAVLQNCSVIPQNLTILHENGEAGNFDTVIDLHKFENRK